MSSKKTKKMQEQIDSICKDILEIKTVVSQLAQKIAGNINYLDDKIKSLELGQMPGQKSEAEGE